MTMLIPMREENLGMHMETAIANYAEGNMISNGWTKEQAMAHSRKFYENSLPYGVETPNHFLYEIYDEITTQPVGFIWLWAHYEAEGLAIVLYLGIEPAFRRQGHARAALAAIEPITHSLGLPGVSLHVFSHNQGAQALYNSLGYGVTGMNMFKRLRENEG